MASPNLIQIKRSQTTATPASLANGELAFTAAGNVVFIGNYGQVLPIAGQRTPGILTANQALVANSTSWIDKINVANATIDSLSANGSYGPSGSVLAVDNAGKIFWSTTAASGPSYVQNTDSRTLSGNLYFTGANTTIENLYVTTINRSPKLTLSGDATGNVTFNNLGDATLNVTITNANGVTLGVDTDGDYVQSITAGNGTSVTGGTGESSTPTIAVVAGTGLVSNSTGVHINPTVTQTFDSLTVNGQTTLNGNVVLGDAIQDRVTLNGSLYGTVIPTSDNTFDIGSIGAVYNTGWFTQLRLGSGSSAYVTASANTIEVHNFTVNSNLIANTSTIYHDLFVGGDLHITGNAIFANVESYIVTDPLIQLAANNTNTDLLDIGFFGNYNVGGGAHEHTGLFRDASDGVYKLFDGLQVTPTTFVDTADGTYNQATLKAYLDSGALVSNSTALNITGTNSLTVAIQANTLTLSTALGYGSGGTGFKTYTDGDLLVGNTTSGLQKLTAGAAGSILQSDGTNLYYGSLDGGSF